MATGPMATGKVDWFNPVMGTGYITPADGGPYASVFSLSTPSGSLDPYVTYICGWAWAYHCNNSSIWLHPIGTGVDGWGPAAYDVYSVYE